MWWLWTKYGPTKYRLPKQCPQCGKPGQMHASLDETQHGYNSRIFESCQACGAHRWIPIISPAEVERRQLNGKRRELAI